jgi:DNA-binding MarR family transcriptional regulator
MKEAIPLSDEYELIKSMVYTCRLIEAASVKPLRKVGLTSETAAVLSGVWSLDNNAKPIEIAKRGARKPQTITANIKKLEAYGLLAKKPDEQKKNVFRVSLTQKGRTALQKASSIYIFERIMASLSREERDNLKNYLEKMEKTVKQILKNTQHFEVI